MTQERQIAQNIRVLLVGSFSASEFQPLSVAIGRIATLQTAADCTSAVQYLKSHPSGIDLVIVAERWPGEHAHTELDRVQRAAPLARLLAVGSSWCEGQARSGTPWPGMLHKVWHSWLTHWETDLIRCSQRELPSFGLPIVANEHERTLFRCFPPQAKDRLIAISSQREDMADMLVTACRDQGYATVWLDPHHPLRIEGPNAILWEGSPDCLDTLQKIHTRYRQAPLIALLDFPRIEDIKRATDMGAAEILPKPTYLEDLFHRLDSLLSDPQTQQNPQHAA